MVLSSHHTRYHKLYVYIPFLHNILTNRQSNRWAHQQNDPCCNTCTNTLLPYSSISCICSLIMLHTHCSIKVGKHVQQLCNEPHRYRNSRASCDQKVLLSPGKGDILILPQPFKAGTQFKQPEGCKAELT